MRDTSKRILGSFKTPSKPKAETIMNKAEPNATKKWVRRPAAFSRYSRSKPMKPPKSAATKMRMINSNVSIIPSFTIVVANLHKKKEACNLSRYKFNQGTKKGSKRAHSLAIGCPSSPIDQHSIHSYCTMGSKLGTNLCAIGLQSLWDYRAICTTLPHNRYTFEERLPNSLFALCRQQFG